MLSKLFHTFHIRNTSISARSRDGFALVVTVSLMVLLAVIAMGMLSLSAVSLRGAALGEAEATARANARMALAIALGELQRHAGPDRRVTARADLLDEQSPNSLLTGVWDSWAMQAEPPPAPGDFERSAKNERFRSWLVSAADPTAPLQADFANRTTTRPVTLWDANPQASNPAFPSIMVLADEVHYRDGGAWDGLADGKGSSLERIDPRADGRLAPNWAASDESQRAGWTLVEHSGVLDHGMGTCNQVHLIMLAGGECLVDEVEVRVHGGPNLVANGGFDAGIGGWSATGNHIDTSHSPPGSGFGGGRALHLRASGGGDTGANLVRATPNTPLAAGQSVTIRARVRWLAGHPTMLVRLRGNYLEADGNLDVPPGGGTPGQVNSRAAANAGPAITAVRHHPALPSIYHPGDATAVHGVAASNPGDFVLLEDEHPSGRPVAATVVESALSVIDANYAAFYQNQVWPHDHAWGTLIPNSLPGGITGLSEISRTTGESLGSVRFDDPWPGTVNPSGGPEPVVIDAFDRYPFWMRRRFPDPAAQSDPLVSGPLADGLGLGVPNLLAYALGLTPGDPANDLRKLSITGGPDGAVLRFPRDPRKVDIAYLLDASPDLSGWPGVLFDSRSDPRPNNDGEFLTIPAADPPGPACQFFRLRIEMPAP